MDDVQKGFDPLEDILMAQFARPPDLIEINLRTLSPFQRALLVIDGTVTKFIEAYTLEPLTIERIVHRLGTLPTDEPWLGLKQGAPVIFREVVIRGRYSRTFFCHAVSMVAPDRLPERVRESLQIQGEGIGRLLNDTELETRREILWFGRERLKTLPPAIQTDGTSDFIRRTYRIIAHAAPIALINERFPYALESQPAHH